MDRKSRLPVSNARSSIVNSVPRRSRSSSTLNPKGPPSSRSRSVTPNSAYRFQKSPLIKKETRPLDNKKWQKEQTSRVEAFIHPLEPGLTKLRPLSTNVFVTVLHHLIKHIDESLEITLANYKTELPDILKAFNYPTKLSPSVIKWPNTDHAYPAILGVWSFLLDKIEELEIDLYEDIKCNLTQEDYEMANYLPKIGIQNYEAAYVGTLSLDDIRAEIERILIKNPKQHKNEKRELESLYNKIHSSKEDKKKLEVELKDIEDIILKKRDSMQQQQEKIEETRNKLEGILRKLKDKSESLEKNIQCKTVEQNHLQEKIDLIGVPKENVAEMEQNITDRKYTNSLLKERHETNMNKLTQLDLQLAQEKRMIEGMVYGINNTLRDVRYLIDDMEPSFLPETGFTNLNYLEIIKAIDVTFFDQKLAQLEQDLKNLSINKEKLLKKHKKKLAKLQSDHVDKIGAFEKYTKILKSVRKEVADLESHVEVLCREIEEIGNSRIDLKKFINLNVEAQARRNILLEASRKQDQQVEELLSQIRKVSVQTNSKLVKCMMSTIGVLQLQQKKQIAFVDQANSTTKTKLNQLKEKQDALELEIVNTEGICSSLEM